MIHFGLELWAAESPNGQARCELNYELDGEEGRILPSFTDTGLHKLRCGAWGEGKATEGGELLRICILLAKTMMAAAAFLSSHASSQGT